MGVSYTVNPIEYSRFPTRVVMVGDVGIGGNNPIRVQSMITSDTTDTESSVKQILDLSRAGCEIVRVTVPSMADAENLIHIRNELKNHKCKTPLVADIHFTPSVAMKAVEYVEKVRINPGNFADKKKFAVKEYTDSEYSLELERISEIFLPLVKRCMELGVAMRIGTNHGSLSDRIMNRYGDTPLGMVESALEFIKIASSIGYHDIVISMKASNPKVMVSAYRLLIDRFRKEKMNYPIHLGVTEAGDGRDGRIKAAMGIGSLLEDGIGDTIRVSLTEDSIYEIPVAKKLVEKYNNVQYLNTNINFQYKEYRLLDTYERILSESIHIGELVIGEKYPVRVESTIFCEEYEINDLLDLLKNAKNNKVYNHEIIHFENANLTLLNHLISFNPSLPYSLDLENFSIHEIKNNENLIDKFQKISLSFMKYSENLEYFNSKREIIPTEIKIKTDEFEKLDLFLQSSNNFKNLILSLNQPLNDYIFNYRKLLSISGKYKLPIILSYRGDIFEDLILSISSEIGSLLLDGLGGSIRIMIKNTAPIDILTFSFDVLQSAGLRTTKTEFISCPSCGRTLFNLQDTTARIKAKTGHLKGVKIAIMGCIVNGPGEMADADFGYVGAGPGKVHLYRGKEIVSKNIPGEIADEKLIELIKSDGKWIDP